MSETRDWTHSRYVLSNFEGEHKDPRDLLEEQEGQAAQSLGDQQTSGELAFFGAGIAEIG